MAQQVDVKKVSNAEEEKQVFAIRREVFVVEQNCPPELEWQNDEDSTHFLAYCDGVPAGAARWRKTEKGYKMERFAVLKEFRGRGVAGALIKTVLDDLPVDAVYIYLHAQVDAMGLYSKYSFLPEGEEFEEAGIRHTKMVYRRPAKS